MNHVLSKTVRIFEIFNCNISRIFGLLENNGSLIAHLNGRTWQSCHVYYSVFMGSLLYHLNDGALLTNTRLHYWYCMTNKLSKINSCNGSLVVSTLCWWCVLPQIILLTNTSRLFHTFLSATLGFLFDLTWRNTLICYLWNCYGNWKITFIFTLPFAGNLLDVFTSACMGYKMASHLIYLFFRECRRTSLWIVYLIIWTKKYSYCTV